MQSAKWMRSVTLAVALTAAAGVMVVLACGPAAVVPQSGGEDTVAAKEEPTQTPAPTFTPTPTAICYTLPTSKGGSTVGCEVDGPRNVPQHLRRAYSRHMERKAEREEQVARGVPAEALESRKVDLSIYVRKADAVGPLVEFLEANGAYVQYSGTKPSRGYAGGAVVDHVDIELLATIAAMDGVGLIEEVKTFTNPFAGVKVDLTVVMGTAEQADALVKFLDSVSDDVGSYQKSSDGTGRVVFKIRRLPAGYMDTIAGMDGFDSMTGGESGPRSAVPRSSSQRSVLELTGAAQWHRAGFTGSGVKVAVFDGNLLGVERLAALRSSPVKFYCYGADGTAVSGQVPAPTPDPSASPDVPPAPSFDVCTSNAPSMAIPHGLLVVEALLEIGPDVDLHVSNAKNTNQLFGALGWLRESGIEVVNHSGGEEWDGPGDGTSPFDNEMGRSTLNVVKDGVEGGAVWVNASGNSAQGTWFRRDPDFTDDGYLDFDRSEQGEDTCNVVLVQDGEHHVIQMRWSGSWGGSDIELVLHLTGSVGGPTEDHIFVVSVNPQSGEDDHYPFERLGFYPGDGVAPGLYCLKVSKNTTDPAPDWLQLQLFEPQKTDVSHQTFTGSMVNPAESNSRGVLSVGASNELLLSASASYSSRGPVPEPHPRGRVEPDLLSDGGVQYQILTLEGTSVAAPRAAGLAALVIDALGDHQFYDEPHEVVRYLVSRSASGFGRLPPLDVPTSLRAEHVPCGVLGNVKLTYDAPTYAGGASGHFRPKYRVVLELVNDPTVSGERELVGTGTAHFVRVPDGKTYRAKEAQTCLPRVGGVCGPVSAATVDVIIPEEICLPREFDAVVGDGVVTLRWNSEDDATEYEVEQEGVADLFDTTDEYLVVSGLTNDTEYRFRVRSKGPLGTTGWSYWRAVRPVRSDSERLPDLGEVVDASAGDFFGQHDATLSWAPAADAGGYEVRMWDGTRTDWRVVPFEPRGWDESYVASFSYGSSDVEVGLDGLIPGTSYAVRVRGTNGDKRSAWSDVTMVKTAGTTPSSAPTLAPIPSAKMPPKDLTATVNGTSVSLAWTAGTNPNYVRQEVWRREVGVTPLLWTETSVGWADTTYIDTGLVSGKQYVYRIRAEKSNGKGGVSTAVTVTIP